MPGFRLEHDTADLCDYLHEQLPSLMAIYVFGSRSQGTANAQSDLDLAVLVEGYAEPLILWQLSQTLADRLNMDVDLLDLRAASTVMQYQVLTTGQRLWSCGMASDEFELFVLSDKFDLDILRQPLLDQIKEDGRIYGR